jgi:murein L,D-transpeptidase YcbB/YkuD
MRPTLKILLICIACCSAAASAQSPARGDLPAVQSEIRSLLETPGIVIEGEKILAEDIVRETYEENDFRPFWNDTGNIRELILLIDKAPEHGLTPEDYSIEQLRRVLAVRERDPTAMIKAEADIMLTESLLRYAYHRRLGKVTASTLDPNINYKRDAFRNQPFKETLRQLLEAHSLQGYIDLVAPSGPYYKGVESWLQRYRQLAVAGGWPPVAEGPTLRLGDADPRVAQIRARLVVTGELPQGSDTGSTLFDEELKKAVLEFQYLHGLEEDGLVGRGTVAAMNVPVEVRIGQLRVSLERLRWVNQEAAQTLVAVNIASFKAFLFRDGEMAWSTRAMVGKDYRRTPIFRGDMQYIEFNPTWTIPPTILRQDTLPSIKHDPDYLASKNIRVIDSSGKFVDPKTVHWEQYTGGVPYTLRQDPGPENALGIVKFIFPNKHSVFLHDTPHRELFDRPERAFSSGCIRIQNPLELAELLLNDEQYREPALLSIVNSRETRRINLKTPIPVVIVYLTASIDEDGNVLFYKDIYDMDAGVLRALDGPVTIDPPTVASRRVNRP